VRKDGLCCAGERRRRTAAAMRAPAGRTCTLATLKHAAGSPHAALRLPPEHLRLLRGPLGILSVVPSANIICCCSWLSVGGGERSAGDKRSAWRADWRDAATRSCHCPWRWPAGRHFSGGFCCFGGGLGSLDMPCTMPGVFFHAGARNSGAKTGRVNGSGILRAYRLYGYYYSAVGGRRAGRR